MSGVRFAPILAAMIPLCLTGPAFGLGFCPSPDVITASGEYQNDFSKVPSGWSIPASGHGAFHEPSTYRGYTVEVSPEGTSVTVTCKYSTVDPELNLVKTIHGAKHCAMELQESEWKEVCVNTLGGGFIRVGPTQTGLCSFSFPIRSRNTPTLLSCTPGRLGPANGTTCQVLICE